MLFGEPETLDCWEQSFVNQVAFVAVAAGRSLFRVDDLLRVALLVGEIGVETCK